MNLFHLSAGDLLIWGIVLHFIADWPLQNDWMANKKMLRANLGMIPGDGMTTAPSRMHPYTLWFVRHPAAYVHSGIHGLLLAIVFGWAAVPIAIAHLIIDCRWPVAMWSRFMRQTQPQGNVLRKVFVNEGESGQTMLYDIGTEVRIWNDQVFHIACIAIATLLVTL